MASICFISTYNIGALGMRMIASMCEEAGHSTSLIFFKSYEVLCHRGDPKCWDQKPNDGFMENGIMIRGVNVNNPWDNTEYDLLKNAIGDMNPDIVAFSTVGGMPEQDVELFGRLRKAMPEKTFVVGGFGPSFHPETYLKIFDYAFFGEGEFAFQEFLKAFESDKDYSKVHNLMYLGEDGEVVRHDLLEPVDPQKYDFPLPLYCKDNILFIDKNELKHRDPCAPDVFGTYFIMMNRVCPKNCAYCGANYFKSLYKDLGVPYPLKRRRTIEDMMSELRLAKDGGAKRINFLDAIFTGPMDYLEEFFIRYREEIGLPFFMYLDASVCCRNPRIIDLARDAGLTDTTVGIQQLNQDFRRNIYNRPQKNEEIIRFAELLIEKKVKFKYDMISGDPLEDDETFEKGLELIPRLPFVHGTSGVCIFKLRRIPHTALTNLIDDKGVDYPPFEEYYYKALMIWCRFMATDEEFEEIHKSELFRKYPDMLKKVADHLFFKNYIGSAPHYIPYSMDEDIYAYYVDKHPDIIIWGTSTRYKHLHTMFLDSNVVGFIDNDKSMQGKVIRGSKVHSIDFLAEHPDVPVFICASAKRDIAKQIRQAYPETMIL